MLQGISFARRLRDSSLTFSRNGCGISPRIALSFALTITLSAATNILLPVKISDETAPPGGWVQLKFSLPSPRLIATGRIVMDLDPTVFGDITDVAVFSANGDAYGMFYATGLHLEADFGCGFGSVGAGAVFTPASRGIGELPGLPILVITVQVLSTATLGKTVPITADAGLNLFTGNIWNDPNGNYYIPSFTPGSVTVGGSLSIQNIVPGGGQLPLGTIVRINGTGFTAQTTVNVDEVSVQATQFIGPREIDITLGAPAELTGKRFVFQNPDDGEVHFFSSLQAASPPGGTGGGTFFPLFAVQAWSGQRPTGSPTASSAQVYIENPGSDAVDVTIRSQLLSFAPQESRQTIPGGGLGGGTISRAEDAAINASGPVRVLQFIGDAEGGEHVTPLYPSAEVINFSEFQFVVNPPSISWQWQIGSPPPPSRTILINSAPSTVSATTSTGGSWLSAQASPAGLVATADPAGLPVGIYQGIITVTSVFASLPVNVAVTLTVTQAPTPLVTVAPASLSFTAPYPSPAPPSQVLTVTGSGGSGTFSVAVDQGIPSGQWLFVSPTNENIPGTVTVSVDLSKIEYPGGVHASIVVTGPENAVSIPVSLNTSGFDIAPASVLLDAGPSYPVQTYTVSATPYVNFSPVTVPVSVGFTTDSGGPWLSAVFNSPNNLAISVYAAGLAPGTYTGTVVMSAQGVGSSRIPVTFVVWIMPPPVTVTPSSLAFTYVIGSGTPPAPQTLKIESGGTPLPLSQDLVQVTPVPASTPATVSVNPYLEIAFDPLSSQFS